MAKRLACFIEAMDDLIFNTPEAYSVLFDMAREVNRLKAEDMAAANARDLTCVTCRIGPAGARTGSVPAKRRAGRRQRSG
ncbi:DALR domain-containing protein [Escherichia coli]